VKEIKVLRCGSPKIIYAILVIITIVTLVSLASVGDFGRRDIAALCAALLGTFLGALFAFRLNENKESELLRKEQITALNSALFYLIRQSNAVIMYNRYLAPWNSTIDRAFNLPAHKLPDYSNLVQDFGRLAFLMDSHPNILMKLVIEDERFHQALEAIRIRNEFYVQEVQPALACLDIQGKDIGAEQLKIGLGERIFGAAITGSEDVYEHIPACVKSLKSMSDDLFFVAKELFPKETFIRFQETQ
jgi:hypothetical protein